MAGVNKDGTGIPISPENKAMLDYGLNTLFKSMDVIKDYVKLMIPLTTALISTYFFLLKFIGIGSSSDVLESNLLLWSPILMLFALTFFILTVFPIPMKITLGNIQSIRHYRNTSTLKYLGAAIGSTLFLLGLLIMILLLIP